MSTKVVHFKKEPYDVYIGRPSKWGNPFSHQEWSAVAPAFIVRTRLEAIEKYREWIQEQPELMAALYELKGKTLGCWCKPKPCHGDVLAELADQCEIPPLNFEETIQLRVTVTFKCAHCFDAKEFHFPLSPQFKDPAVVCDIKTSAITTYANLSGWVMFSKDGKIHCLCDRHSAMVPEGAEICKPL